MDQQFRWRTRALSRSNNFSLLALCCDDALTRSDISHWVCYRSLPRYVDVAVGGRRRPPSWLIYLLSPCAHAGRREDIFVSVRWKSCQTKASSSTDRPRVQTDDPAVGDRTPGGTRRARDISGPMAMETKSRVVYLYVCAGRTGSRRHVPTHRHVAT